MWVPSLGWEDPLEKGIATHSSTLAWEIPRTEEPCRLQSMGSRRLGHDWETHFHFQAVRIWITIFPKGIMTYLLCQAVCDNGKCSIEGLGRWYEPRQQVHTAPFTAFLFFQVRSFLVPLLMIHFYVFSESFQNPAIGGATQIPPPLGRVPKSPFVLLWHCLSEADGVPLWDASFTALAQPLFLAPVLMPVTLCFALELFVDCKLLSYCGGDSGERTCLGFRQWSLGIHLDVRNLL